MARLCTHRESTGFRVSWPVSWWLGLLVGQLGQQIAQPPGLGHAGARTSSRCYSQELRNPVEHANNVAISGRVAGLVVVGTSPRPGLVSWLVGWLAGWVGGWAGGNHT